MQRERREGGRATRQDAVFPPNPTPGVFGFARQIWRSRVGDCLTWLELGDLDGAPEHEHECPLMLRRFKRSVASSFPPDQLPDQRVSTELKVRCFG
jgi:hypothetical protein